LEADRESCNAGFAATTVSGIPSVLDCMAIPTLAVELSIERLVDEFWKEENAG
jgi:hypothetical protein